MRHTLSPCEYIAKHIEHSVSPPSKIATSSARRGVTGALAVEGASEAPIILGGPSPLSSESLVRSSGGGPRAAAGSGSTTERINDLGILRWLYVLMKPTVPCCVVERVGGACVSRAAAEICVRRRGEGDLAR